MKKFLFGLTLSLGSVAVFAQDGGIECYNKGVEALNASDFKTAYLMLDKALTNPGEMEIQADYYYYTAMAAEKSENYDAAVKYYDQAIKAKSNVDNSTEGKARSLVALGKYEEAIVSDAVNAGKWAYNSAATAYKADDFENAAKYFAKAVELDYNGDSSASFLYTSLLKLGKEAEALEALKSAAIKYPQSKVSEKYAVVIYKDAVSIYKEGVGILTAANNAVNAGTYTTEDDKYKAALTSSTAKLKEAVTVFEQVLSFDATNANAKKYLDACKAAIH
ncbi:MAG: tetratricopeptide repeat protein [Mangrovibacterium sp.]